MTTTTHATPEAVPLLLIDENTPLPALPQPTKRPTPEEEAAFFAEQVEG